MRSRSTTFLLMGMLLLGGLTGCLGTPDGSPDEPTSDPATRLDHAAVSTGLEALERARAAPLELRANVTVNVVFVGLDMGLVDTDAVLERLPSDYSPQVPFGKSRSEGWRSGLMHDLDYRFHQAPAAFAQGLFEAYATFAEEVEVPGGNQGFLAHYDRMYELGRLEDGTIHRVDAEKVETWIHDNRADHGLAFEDPEYTVFLLDSWTDHGLWADSYYWYEFKNDTRGGAGTNDMRAWGGTYDFLFMDYSAAPNIDRDENKGITKVDVCCGISVAADAPEGSAYNDPPRWHYDGDTATIGKGPLEKTVRLTDRVAHALDTAVNIRLIGSYAFQPIYSEHYHVNVHLWHDGRSKMPTDGWDALITPERIRPGIQAEIPWANVTVSVDTYVLPEDDPGMAGALERAKAEGGESHVPVAPLYEHIDGNADQYKQNQEGVVDVMALFFLLEGGHAIGVPLVAAGIAFAGPDGTAWGTASSVNDLVYVGNGQDQEAMAHSLIATNAHEIGHFFGLWHAHDGSRRTADGYEPILDHTWSSTRTVMSYRMRPESTGTFHLDTLARVHGLFNLENALRNAHSAYRALSAAGVAETPPNVLAPLERATTHYDDAHQRFLAGDYQGSIHEAIHARRATERAMVAAGVVERTVVVDTWTNQSVNAAGVKPSPAFLDTAITPTGVLRDYRPVQITDDVEKITVRVTWANSPDSWGDFFAGWSLDPLGLGNLGPVPLGRVVDLGGGVHDSDEEGPSSGEVSESFTLDLDTFRLIRQLGVVYAGAGARGNAVDGAYQVELVVTYRDHGDGGVPQEVRLDASDGIARPASVGETVPVRSCPDRSPAPSVSPQGGIPCKR